MCACLTALLCLTISIADSEVPEAEVTTNAAGIQGVFGQGNNHAIQADLNHGFPPPPSDLPRNDFSSDDASSFGIDRRQEVRNAAKRENMARECYSAESTSGARVEWSRRQCEQGDAPLHPKNLDRSRDLHTWQLQKVEVMVVRKSSPFRASQNRFVCQ